jgi:hypothetical protein
MIDHNKAIEMKPNYADAFFNRGFAKDDKGDLEGADVSKALELDSSLKLTLQKSVDQIMKTRQSSAVKPPR